MIVLLRVNTAVLIAQHNARDEFRNNRQKEQDSVLSMENYVCSDPVGIQSLLAPQLLLIFPMRYDLMSVSDFKFQTRFFLSLI